MLSFPTPNTDTSLQPFNNQANNPLPQINNTQEKPKNLQKERHVLLTGMENQLLDFDKFCVPHEDKPQDFNQSIGDGTRSLKNTKVLNGYKEITKPDLTAELNKFYNVMQSYFEQFKDLKSQLDKASTSWQQSALQDSFNIRSNAFKKNKDDISKCFANSKTKLNSLKLRIERDRFHKATTTPVGLNDFIYLMKKGVRDDFIETTTNEAVEKAKTRIKTCATLEATLQKTLLRYEEVVNVEEHLKLSLEAIPGILKEKQLALSQLSESLIISEQILSELDMEKFSKDFTETGDKRDLTVFYNVLDNCKNYANGMLPFKATLDTINDEFLLHSPSEEAKEKNDFSTTIKNAVKNISLKIKELENSIGENLGDKIFRKQQDEQRQCAIANLQNLRNDIITKYNAYRMELNNANYRSLVFNRMINPKAKLVRLYLDTEETRATLREMRKTKKSTRKQHEEVYNTCKPKLQGILNQIFVKDPEPLFYNSSLHTLTSVDDCSRMIVIETTMAQILSEQIAELTADDNVYFNSQATINSLIGCDEKNNLLTEKIKNLKTHLKDEKDEILNAYNTTLKNMCIWAEEEIEMMDTAFTYEGYDNNFEDAYKAKWRTSNKPREKWDALFAGPK